MERRRMRPVFGGRPKVTGAEHERREPRDVFRQQRVSPRKPHFDGGPGGGVDAGEARRQRRGVVRHDDVAVMDETWKVGPRTMRDRSILIDDEKLRVRCALNRYGGRDH
jgi:hypothetical protein